MSRESVASLAIIERAGEEGSPEVLTLWSSGWQRFALPGGHVEAGESPQEACSRELQEELLCDAAEIEMQAEPASVLRFEDYSRSADEMTKYTWYIYRVRLKEDLLRRLEQDKRSAYWTTLQEALAGTTSRKVSFLGTRGEAVEGRQVIADQVSRAWVSFGSKVTWMAGASQDVDEGFQQQIDWELMRVFHEQQIHKIIVKQRFAGYVDRPKKKLIIGVELQFDKGSAAHVVKLGTVDSVGGDLQAWEECAARQGVASRMFIAPVSGNISDRRQAAIYSDVYQYYFDDGQDDKPRELEFVVESCIHKENTPTVDSVERVLSQVYTEAHRCFYRKAKEETQDEGKWDRLTHIFSGLRVGGSPSGRQALMAMWDEPEYQKLRRGAAWITSRDRDPADTSRPKYIDPIDFLHWALGLDEANEVQDGQTPPGLPPMLVGPSHGDLHGRNVIVGISRGEAEWPAVFDFDKMSQSNIVAWDFAKLEIELKCRLFQALIDSPEERKALRQQLGMPDWPEFPATIELSGEEHRVRIRAEMMELMFKIERILHSWTEQISNLSRAKRAAAEYAPDIGTSTAIGRAMRIVLRIRREAAIFLGFERSRATRWRDEYYFALASYGVITAKWPVETEHLIWAMISAGVASAELSQFDWNVDVDRPPELARTVSYAEVLPYAQTCWKRQRAMEPVDLLRESIEKYPYAPALQQQLALSLATSSEKKDEAEAYRLINPMVKLACAFRDHEMLCRLGRVYKDRGDACFAKNVDGEPYTLERVIADSLPAFQYYQASFGHYYNAYAVSHHYYPAINAATMALLTGQGELQEQLADHVLTVCSQVALDAKDRLWVLASEGEAALLLHRPQQAIRFYTEALAYVLETESGVVQSMYDQLCRLHWALGAKLVQPVIDAFGNYLRLEGMRPGPFGNCGRDSAV